MTGTDCGLFTHKSVPVIFEPPCIYHLLSVEFFSVTILPLIVFGTGVFIDLLHIQVGTVVYPGLPFPSYLPIFFTLKVISLECAQHYHNLI